MCKEEQESDRCIREHMVQNAHIAFVEVRTDYRKKTMRVFGTHFVDVPENREGTMDGLRKGTLPPTRQIYAYTWDGYYGKVCVRIRARDIVWLGGTTVLPAYQPKGYDPTRLLPWALKELENTTGLAHHQQ